MIENLDTMENVSAEPPEKFIDNTFTEQFIHLPAPFIDALPEDSIQ